MNLPDIPVTGERQCIVGVRAVGLDAAGQFETEPLKAPFVRKEYADALRARIQALAKYAEHTHASDWPCDCGLTALLDQLRSEGLIK